MGENILFWIALSVAIGATLWYHDILPERWFITGFTISLALILLTFNVAWALVKQDKLSYNEYWNGYELVAKWDKWSCSRDSGCKFTYNCDPYEVTTYTYDDKGNISGSYTTTYYHHCPYTTEEWDFNITTTLGDYQIDHTIPDSPQAYRNRAIPNLPKGIPAFWQAANQRLLNHTPGPVTKRMQYDNYILASDSTILNQYSDKIEQFKSQGLLPNVASSVRDFYYADKVYFVGDYKPTEDWSTPLSYLDAAFGTELQGDLHLVIVPGLQEPDAYITALKAYWTDSKVFGDNTISKNSFILVLGTNDGKTVSYARAITGMPLGNEYLIQKARDLEGALLSPSVILGHTNGEIYVRDDGKTKVKAVHGTGLLDRLLWGLDDPKTRFTRISMSGNDADDNGSGFGYLADQIEPSEGQQSWISLGIGIVFVFIFWAITVWAYIGGKNGTRY